MSGELEFLTLAEAIRRALDAHLMDCEFHGQDWFEDCEQCQYWGPVHQAMATVLP